MTKKEIKPQFTNKATTKKKRREKRPHGSLMVHLSSLTGLRLVVLSPTQITSKVTQRTHVC